MKNLKTLLRDADPLRDEDELSLADVQAMRRTMLAAVREPVVRLPFWQRPLAVAAIVLLMVGVGVAVGRQMPDREVQNPVGLAAADPAGAAGYVRPVAGGDRLQLQFSTPGGTRIIWVFDQNFRLQESMP